MNMNADNDDCSEVADAGTAAAEREEGESQRGRYVCACIHITEIYRQIYIYICIERERER